MSVIRSERRRNTRSCLKPTDLHFRKTLITALNRTMYVAPFKSHTCPLLACFSCLTQRFVSLRVRVRVVWRVVRCAAGARSRKRSPRGLARGLATAPEQREAGARRCLKRSGAAAGGGGRRGGSGTGRDRERGGQPGANHVGVIHDLKCLGRALW